MRGIPFWYRHPYLYTIRIWVEALLSYLILLCMSPAMFIVWVGGEALNRINAHPNPVHATKIFWLRMKEMKR